MHNGYIPEGGWQAWWGRLSWLGLLLILLAGLLAIAWVVLVPGCAMNTELRAKTDVPVTITNFGTVNVTGANVELSFPKATSQPESKR